MSQRMVTCSGVGLRRFVEVPSPFGVGAIVVCVLFRKKEKKESWRWRRGFYFCNPCSIVSYSLLFVGMGYTGGSRNENRSEENVMLEERRVRSE